MFIAMSWQKVVIASRVYPIAPHDEASANTRQIKQGAVTIFNKSAAQVFSESAPVSGPGKVDTRGLSLKVLTCVQEPTRSSP